MTFGFVRDGGTPSPPPSGGVGRPGLRRFAGVSVTGALALGLCVVGVSSAYAAEVPGATPATESPAAETGQSAGQEAVPPAPESAPPVVPVPDSVQEPGAPVAPVQPGVRSVSGAGQIRNGAGYTGTVPQGPSGEVAHHGFWGLLDDAALSWVVACVDAELGDPNWSNAKGELTTYGDLVLTAWPGMTTAERATLVRLILDNVNAKAGNEAAAQTQTAIWIMTGLNGMSLDTLNSLSPNPAATIAGAKAKIAAAKKAAIIDASARVDVSLSAGGASGSVVTQLVENRAVGGKTTAAAGAYQGTVTLTGATFEDGTTVKAIGNAKGVPIVPTKNANGGFGVTAKVSFAGVKAGTEIYVASPTNNPKAQRVVAARPVSVTANASDTMSMPAFSTTAAFGTTEDGGVCVFDTNHVADLTGKVEIDSILWAIPLEAGQAPEDLYGQPVPDTATEIDTVTTTVTGDGDTRTDCIDVSEYTDVLGTEEAPVFEFTAESDGGTGIAAFAEDTIVEGQAVWTPVLETKAQSGNEQGTDTIIVSRWNPAVAGLDVTSLLHVAPTAFPAGTGAYEHDDSQVAGEVTTTVTGNGEFTTAPVPHTGDELHGVFTYEVAGDESGLVPSFEDSRVYNEELVTWPAPVVPASVTGPGLAHTGFDAGLAPWLALGAAGLGGAGVAFGVHWRRRTSARAEQ